MAEFTKKDILEQLNSPIIKALDDRGITADCLAKKLKAELAAKETKPFKAKVSKFIDPNDVTKGVYETEEVIYSKRLLAWEVRQKARMDAHKLRGDYPPEEQNHRFPDGPVKFEVEFVKKGGNGSQI
jgi:hypothetical protein